MPIHRLKYRPVSHRDTRRHFLFLRPRCSRQHPRSRSQLYLPFRPQQPTLSMVPITLAPTVTTTAVKRGLIQQNMQVSNGAIWFRPFLLSIAHTKRLLPVRKFIDLFVSLVAIKFNSSLQ